MKMFHIFQGISSRESTANGILMYIHYLFIAEDCTYIPTLNNSIFISTIIYDIIIILYSNISLSLVII